MGAWIGHQAAWARLPDGTLLKFTLDGLTLSCPVATSAYRRTFSRTRQHPTTFHGKPGRFITSPSCAVPEARPGDEKHCTLNRPGVRNGFRAQPHEKCNICIFARISEDRQVTKVNVRVFLGLAGPWPFANFR